MPLPRYTDIVNLIKKGSTVEAQEMIMALREGAIELQEENLNLKSRIAELESILKIKQDTIWEDPFYWVVNGEEKDGPFCQKCFDVEEKLIRLPRSTLLGYWLCNECKSEYKDKNYKKLSNTIPGMY